MKMFARLYRWSLRLLPRGLGELHGEEMTAWVAAAAAEAGGRGGSGSAVWLRAIGDVMARAMYEWWRQRRRAGKRRSAVWMPGADMRLAVRGFVREPGMTGLMVLMLALGIAANTAVFSLIDGLFLRPFPFEESERLVYLNETAPRWNLEYTGVNYPDFHGWRERSRVFEGMALYDLASFNLSDGESADRVEGLAVTHDFAEVLGIVPIIGRDFTAEEDRPNGAGVAMLGWQFWQSRFGGASDVVGRTLRLDGEAVTVVGVLPREAVFPAPAALWVPLAGDPGQTWQSYSHEGVGRLLPGVGLEEARSDLERAHAPIWEANDEERTVSPRVEELRTHEVGDYEPMALALAGSVALVLLIACANVASVLLARATARRREIGIRMALGAPAWRVARQLLTESMVLSLTAGGVGLLLGYWGSRAIVASIPEQLPPWAVFTLNWRVVAFSVLAATFAAVLFGWAPIVLAKRSSLSSVLTATSGRTTASGGSRRTLNGLVVAEVALALVLLVSGGLLLVAFQRLQALDPGFRTDGVLSFRIALPEPPNNAEDAAIDPGILFYEQLLERVRALPGVGAAGAITCPPLDCHQGNFFEAEGEAPRAPGQADPVVLTRVATPGYFEAAGIAIRNGRSFSDSDGVADSARVAIVNEMLAEQLWPGVENPVGRRLRYRGRDGSWYTLVGVARNVKHYGLDEPARPGVYLPLRQEFRRSLAIVVYASVEPSSLVSSIRAVVRDMDPGLPVFQVGSMADAVARSMSLRRTYSSFLALFAILALALAAGGLYGVISYGVTQRTKEMGIRVALGAKRQQLVALVMGQGMRLVAGGLLIGVVIALAAARLLSSLLVGVSSRDVLVFSMASATLVSAAILANLIPAWRAARLDPHTALRDDSI